MDTRPHRAPRPGREHPLARRPRRGQWAAAGDRRWDRGQRPGHCGRCPARPGLRQAEYLDQPVSLYTVDARWTTARSFGSATPTGRSSTRPGTPPATCRCGSRRSGCWWSAMPSRTTTSAGSTSPWTGPTRPPPPSLPAPAGRPGPAGAAARARDEVEPYLHARAWLADAARLLNRTPEVLAAELVDTMLRSGAIVLRGVRLRATAEHTPVAAGSLRGRSPVPGRQRHRQERSCRAAVTPLQWAGADGLEGE
jgi:hypothetical protein